MNNSSTSLKRQITVSRIKRKLLKHVWVARVLFLGVAIAVFAVIILTAAALLKNTAVGKYVKFGWDFAFPRSAKITAIDSRINILILGKSGPGHEGADLTDTIIVASIDTKNSAGTLISVPRDLWITSIRAKINSAYYWGNQKAEGGGIILAKSTVEEIVGVPVQNAVVVDFSAFEKVIDVIGGIEMEVERSFEDKKFPIKGREDDECGGDLTYPEGASFAYSCRYETIKFEKGIVIMDGATALKFVRSRTAEGDEGTDTARAARQQKVIRAIIQKAATPEVFLNPAKIKGLLDIAKTSLETDIPESEAAYLMRKIFDSRKNLTNYVIPEELLENPPISARYDDQYVFVPKSGNWNQIQEWVKSVLP